MALSVATYLFPCTNQGQEECPEDLNDFANHHEVNKSGRWKATDAVSVKWAACHYKREL